MTLPKNASRQVPDWRMHHRPHPEKLPLRAAERNMDRHLEWLWSHAVSIQQAREFYGAETDLKYADDSVRGAD